MGLSTDGNLRFKIDWASLVGSKFTVFALGQFSKYPPRGFYLEGRFNGGYWYFALPLNSCYNEANPK